MPILFALFTLNAAGDTLSFAYVELDPGDVPPFPPPAGTTSASYSGTVNSATNSASADLATGMLGVLNAGTDATASGVYETIAQLGDTITATGSASGLSGLNLGVNISENGTTSFSDPSGNFSWLWVFMLAPGTFDQSEFTAPGQYSGFERISCWAPARTPCIAGCFLRPTMWLWTGFRRRPNTIPLQIPFDTIGSNFQIEVVLGSEPIFYRPEHKPGRQTSWTQSTCPYRRQPRNTHLGLGLLPGAVGTVPEPSSLPLAASMIAVIILALEAKRRRKTT